MKYGIIVQQKSLRNGASEESPGFPGLYRNSEICDGFPVVRLKSQGNRLFLRFQSLNLESYFTVRYEQYEAGTSLSFMERILCGFLIHVYVAGMQKCSIFAFDFCIFGDFAFRFLVFDFCKKELFR